MGNNLRYTFLISLFFHFILFYFTSRATSKKLILGPLPVELVRIYLPVEFFSIIEKEKKTEEIVLPKKIIQPVKKKKEKPEEVKPKEAKPEEEKKISPLPPVSSLPPVQGLGSGISIEAAKFPYTYYLNLIREKVGKNWRWPTSSTNKKTIIYFRVLKDGTVSEIKTKKSSDDEFFDLAALRAVEFSAPFPPLPPGFPEEYLGVYFEFSFQ